MLLSWPNAQPGSWDLTVIVDDGTAAADQRFTLVVGSEPAPLELSAALSPSIAQAGQSVSAQAAAVAGSAPPPQTRELLLTVRDAGDATAPVALIASPAVDSEVTRAVAGTATDADFAYYQLLPRPSTTLTPAASVAAPPWTEIGRGLFLSAIVDGKTADACATANRGWRRNVSRLLKNCFGPLCAAGEDEILQSRPLRR